MLRFFVPVTLLQFFHTSHLLFTFLNCVAHQILDLLIPEEEADLSDLVLEVTAGVGGQEAMLFTAEVWKGLWIIEINNIYTYIIKGLNCSC